ncbi:hypothetical protein IWX76_000730 [Pedobacter sp. CAN_A7]
MVQLCLQLVINEIVGTKGYKGINYAESTGGPLFVQLTPGNKISS